MENAENKNEKTDLKDLILIKMEELDFDIEELNKIRKIIEKIEFERSYKNK